MNAQPFSANNLLRASALLLAVLAAACAVEAEPATVSVADTRHQAQIETAYALSPYLRSNLLEVYVREGHVTLSGAVQDSASSELAVAIARAVDGISVVDSQIEVNPNFQPQPPVAGQRSFGSVVEDATITAAIKSKLLWSRHASGLDTDVTTRDGKVTLHGTADSAAARTQAQELAHNTQGVAAVDNQITLEQGAEGAVSSVRLGRHHRSDAAHATN